MARREYTHKSLNFQDAVRRFSNAANSCMSIFFRTQSQGLALYHVREDLRRMTAKEVALVERKDYWVYLQELSGFLLSMCIIKNPLYDISNVDLRKLQHCLVNIQAFLVDINGCPAMVSIKERLKNDVPLCNFQEKLYSDFHNDIRAFQEILTLRGVNEQPPDHILPPSGLPFNFNAAADRIAIPADPDTPLAARCGVWVRVLSDIREDFSRITPYEVFLVREKAYRNFVRSLKEYLCLGLPVSGVGGQAGTGAADPIDGDPVEIDRIELDPVDAEIEDIFTSFSTIRSLVRDIRLSAANVAISAKAEVTSERFTTLDYICSCFAERRDVLRHHIYNKTRSRNA